MCGVIGIVGNTDVFRDLYQGMLAIQHRGQDSAGIITYDGRFHIKKGNGLVQDIFKPEHTDRLKGLIGIGHTRYPTIGGGAGEDAQPFVVNSPFGIMMAHNGNVVNYAELKAELFAKYHRILSSENDVEIILNVFAEELDKVKSEKLAIDQIAKAVEGVYRKVRGSYSVVAYIADQGLVAFRDPYGIKPLSYAVRNDGLRPSYAFASESVALNIMNFGPIKNVEAGQVAFLDHERKLHLRKITRHQLTPQLRDRTSGTGRCPIVPGDRTTARES